MQDKYLNLKIGARARLELLRKSAAGKNWVRPMTWRECRFANFKIASTLSEGKNEGKPIWYAFGQQFPREQYADEVDSYVTHKGWFCDEEQDEKARGIIVRLPHGLFLAGYEWSANDERVYYPELYTDEKDAAQMADEHARIFADNQREHNAKFRDAQRIESEIEQAQSRHRAGSVSVSACATNPNLRTCARPSRN